MSSYIPQCTLCSHYRRPAVTGGLKTCAAFPEGIPVEIWENRVDHREPYAGDNGVRFQAVEGFRHPLSPYDHERQPVSAR